MPINIEFSDPLNGWLTDDRNIYRTTDGGINWTQFQNLQSSNHWYFIQDLFILDSNSAWICTLDGRVFSLSLLQSTDENVEPELISYYPNPVSYQLTIELNNEIRGPLSIRIFSIDGKLVSSWHYSGLSQDRLTIDLSSYPGGLYLLNCQGSSISESFKLVKE
jgi:hypothetical protein